MATALAAARAKTKGKRMLRDALDAYGDEDLTLSDWNARKRRAESDGQWTWKQSVSGNIKAAALKARFEKEQAHFLDEQIALEQEMTDALHASANQQATAGLDEVDDNQCEWRERISGKMYHCINTAPLDKKKKRTAINDEQNQQQAKTNQKRFCRWHARECICDDHPMEKSRAIEIPNEFGLCLYCYEVTATTQRQTLQKVPPRVGNIKIPGVSTIDLRRDVKKDILRKLQNGSTWSGNSGAKITAHSVCSWQKEHFEKAYVWRCTNRVLMHPTLHGSYLPFCGFHVPRCIKEYGGQKKKTKTKNGDDAERSCQPIDRLNPFGLCRNHLEAHLSTLTYDQRGNCKLVDSEFDVPGIKECKKEKEVIQVMRHPLAPRCMPLSVTPFHSLAAQYREERFHLVTMLPSSSRSQTENVAIQLFMTITIFLNGIIWTLLNHPNVVSASLKEAVWRFQFLRRAQVVAIRIQRIFRGNRARKRVRALRYEQAALCRMVACRVIQRIVRGYLGRRRFVHEFDRVHEAVPHLQRLVRGGLARKRCRKIRATIRIQQNYRYYRQRLLAWEFREEMAYMRALQKEANANYKEMDEKLYVFRRLRARRVLRAQMTRWKKRKEMQERDAAFRIQSLMGAVKIQRQWRRYQRYHRIKMLYSSAQMIQKRVRGWLTRHLWKDDPGVTFVCGYINPTNGFEYGRMVILAQPSRSYSYPSRCIRMRCGTMIIQRVFRGHRGRLHANEKQAEMLKIWEWIGIESTDSNGVSSDSMTVGRKKYGSMLPSFNYHEQSRLHMKPIVHDVKPDRGFAYKYQNILELIKDRDGTRAWSLAQEQKWLREQERLSSKPHLKLKSMKRKPNFAESKPITKSVSIWRALFPLGTIVNVRIQNGSSCKKALHRGKIVAIHEGKSNQVKPTFDIEYEPGFISIRGVRTYAEDHVSASRLQHITSVDAADTKRKPRELTGKQTAIDSLKEDLTNNSSISKLSNVTTYVENGALRSVDEIVQRLRDVRCGFDLLEDQARFVNFVFQNSTLLRQQWLQVVDDLKYGKGMTQMTASDLPSSATMEFFSNEFGLESSPNNRKRCAGPMPERALDVETRLIALGFTRNSDANASNSNYQRDENIQSAIPTRPETSSTLISVDKRASGIYISQSQDDSALSTSEKAIRSSQDLHRLIYELKTLPRERKRDKIIEISSRHARSYVCGHPACGRCFSSEEATRLHQKSEHEGQSRLASANPLVDQYLHTYWPPESPWNQELHSDMQRMVGYFNCKQSGCESLQFRTRRELHRHLTVVHGKKIFKQEESVEPQMAMSNGFALTNARPIWLGTYSSCRDLYEKLGFASQFKDMLPCNIHTKRPDKSCKTCLRLQNYPVMPCRIYSTVALPLSCNKNLTSEDSNLDHLDSTQSYTIFNVQDQEFCPAVNIHNVYFVGTGSVSDVSKRTAGSSFGHATNNKSTLKSSEEMAFIRFEGLCRDAYKENWAVGFVFTAQPCIKSREHKLIEPCDEYQVFLNQDRLACVRLSDVVGAAMIRQCSKKVFYRKYLTKDGICTDTQTDATLLTSVCSTIVAERYWIHYPDFNPPSPR